MLFIADTETMIRAAEDLFPGYQPQALHDSLINQFVCNDADDRRAWRLAHFDGRLAANKRDQKGKVKNRKRWEG
jgi:hypothetical protein